MSDELRFHRAARAELREAAFWYEARGAGLGAEFVAEIGACLARIVEKPAQSPKCAALQGCAGLWRAGFPYAIVFLVHDDTITVLAVAHARRRPLYWRTRGTR